MKKLEYIFAVMRTWYDNSACRYSTARAYVIKESGEKVQVFRQESGRTYDSVAQICDELARKGYDVDDVIKSGRLISITVPVSRKKDLTDDSGCVTVAFDMVGQYGNLESQGYIDNNYYTRTWGEL